MIFIPDASFHLFSYYKANHTIKSQRPWVSKQVSFKFQLIKMPHTVIQDVFKQVFKTQQIAVVYGFLSYLTRLLKIETEV